VLIVTNSKQSLLTSDTNIMISEMIIDASITLLL